MEIAWRKRRVRRTGGGRGTGIEPSPRRPAWGKVSQRTPRLQPTRQGLAKTADARKGRRRALYRAKAPATVNFRRGLSSDGIFAFVASLGACLLRRVSQAKNWCPLGWKTLYHA